jgi:predicted DsbA family dithiol-disulfide isomerase
MESKVSEMTVKMKIDFVSDVSCPWCVIGLKSLETALAKLVGDVQADIHFTDGRNPSDHCVLVDVAGSVGLDAARAAQILDSDEYAPEVRAREQFYTSRGINAVPSVIINDRHLIRGGQPAEVFEQTLKELAGEARESA